MFLLLSKILTFQVYHCPLALLINFPLNLNVFKYLQFKHNDKLKSAMLALFPRCSISLYLSFLPTLDTLINALLSTVQLQNITVYRASASVSYFLFWLHFACILTQFCAFSHHLLADSSSVSPNQVFCLYSKRCMQFLTRYYTSTSMPIFTK